MEGAPTVAMAIATFYPATYLPVPTADQVVERIRDGACPVCEARVKGCWCRRCEAPACAAVPGGGRYWLSQRRHLRALDGPHHGIKVEACPACRAQAGRS